MPDDVVLGGDVSVLRATKDAARTVTPVRMVRAVQSRRNRWRHRQQARFDARHGTDTGGYLLPEDMQGAGAAHACHYEATWPGSVRRMIREADVDTAGRTFIDIGSGKGAVLLGASAFPFRRIIGVEHEPSLHEVAERNIEIWLRHPRVTSDIASICADARSYDLPDEPLLLFLSNPFDLEATDEFLARLRSSLDASPRPVDAITFNRLFEDRFDEAPWIERTHKGWNHATYRLRA